RMKKFEVDGSGHWMAVSSLDGIAVFNMTDAAPRLAWRNPKEQRVSTQVAFAADGTRMACWRGANSADVIETGTWRTVGSVVCDDPVEAVAFEPSGRRCATASRDGRCRIWNCEGKPELLETLDCGSGIAKSIAWMPDGTGILVGTSEGLIYWFEVGTKRTIA